jgi:hypothetical protein
VVCVPIRDSDMALARAVRPKNGEPVQLAKSAKTIAKGAKPEQKDTIGKMKGAVHRPSISRASGD